MDESGTHDNSHNCVIGGYWGSVNEWRRFERRWKAALKEEDVEEFHANEFWPRLAGSRIGPYKGWSDARHQGFINKLLGIIETTKVYPLICGVLGEEWAKQPPFYKEIFAAVHRTGEKPSGKRLKPIFLPFQICVIRAASYCHPGITMHFVLDQNPLFQGAAAKCFGALRREMEVDTPSAAKHFGELTFADSKKALPLQAADLLVYEAHRYAKQAKGKKDLPVRLEYRRALRNFKHMNDFMLFDGQRFQNLVVSLEETRKKS